MKHLRKIAHVLLTILTGFLSLTGLLGGIALLAGIGSPPVEQLQGSVFNDFLIPGMALLVMVGGSALVATVLLIRNNRFALLFSTATGTVIMVFEFVEVLVIGSPAGIAITLQVFYFGLGVIITLLSVSIGFFDLSGIKNF